jgi:hypothetical protein
MTQLQQLDLQQELNLCLVVRISTCIDMLGNICEIQFMVIAEQPDFAFKLGTIVFLILEKL